MAEGGGGAASSITSDRGGLLPGSDVPSSSLEVTRCRISVLRVNMPDVSKCLRREDQ